jgi:NAD(P)-dependent dehydrogenase (short-subunit alcohol dehydrogenase family)
MNILVTGGSSGLGEAITCKLAQNPTCKVYFTYNQSEQNAKAIECKFSNTKAFKCNFKIKDEIDRLCAEMFNLDIDILINNAYTGSFLASHFHKTPVIDFESGFNDNIIPVIALTQAAINVFRKKKFGRIITILSKVITDVPPVGTSVYLANKAYLHALSKIWAVENAKFNITSNTVSPSFMLTNFTSIIDERIVEQIKESHPDKKILTVAEASEAISDLIDKSSQLNAYDLKI